MIGDHATSGTERGEAPLTEVTAGSGTIHSLPAELSSTQPFETRRRVPASRPTPSTPSASSVSSDAISRLASVTAPYSARVRSASSASRSAA